MGNLVPNMSALVKTWTSAPAANKEAHGAAMIVLSQVKNQSSVQIDSSHLGSAREERRLFERGRKRGVGL